MCTGPGEPPEDGEMIEMTLSSRHRNRNSSPGGLRPSTLPLGHEGSPQCWLSHVDGEETFCVSFKPPRPGTEPRTLAWKAAMLTTNLGPTFAPGDAKWNESGFRPLLCTYRLNRAGKPPEDGEMSAITLPSRQKIKKLKPWSSEAKHATSWSRRLPTILAMQMSSQIMYINQIT